MKAVRGQWMLVSLFLGLAMTATAEDHGGAGTGTARRQAPGETPQRVFSNALNACGLSQGAGVGSTFTAAPPPPPPPPVFPEGDVAPTLNEDQIASTGPAEAKPEAKPEAEAKPAATAAKPEANVASQAPQAKPADISDAEAAAIMAKVNCKSCHGDGRNASEYSAKDLADEFTRVPKMRAKLTGAEVAQLRTFLAGK